MLDELPLEIIHAIAQVSESSYYALITSYPRFARSVTAGVRVDFRIEFGHDVHICEDPKKSDWFHDKLLGILWTRNGKPHRLDEPAFENMYKKDWYKYGIHICTTGHDQESVPNPDIGRGYLAGTMSSDLSPDGWDESLFPEDDYDLDDIMQKYYINEISPD